MSIIKKIFSKWHVIFLYVLGLPKTIYFNLKYFPLREAIWLPVFVSHRVLLKLCAGEVRILAPIHTRMIQIGFGDVGIFDAKYSRSIWEVNGFVEFQGVARLGHGTKISVGENASLVLGKEVGITAETSIVCMKRYLLEREH